MITGIVTTLNESKNIQDCIQSLQQVCSEIIIVDSESSDNTIDLAKDLGAKTVIQSYLGDGIQKNVALDYTNNDWVLSLDADERLTDEMVSAIKKLDLETTLHDAFAFRRRNYVGSRWIKQCGWYPDFCIRLFNRHKTRFNPVKQHSYVTANNPKRLNADIIHYRYERMGHVFSKPERDYSKRGAKILYKQGRRVNSFTPFIHGLNSFIREYILQRGFLAGVDGLSISIAAALTSYLKYAYILEYQRDPKVLENEDFDSIW